MNQRTRLLDPQDRTVPMSIRVFTDGVYDLFHKGHLEALRKARSFGSYLLVGVNSDEGAMTYKRRPIIPLEQRLQIVSAITWVDEAIETPLYLTDDFYARHRIDIHCQGEPVLDFYDVGEKLGMMRYVGRDESVNTSMIIDRILQQ